MSRSRLSLAVAIVSVAGVVSARQEAQFRTANDTVPIYATVVNREGHLVTDLTRDDFEVLDNGKPQPLTMFVNGEQPITVVWNSRPDRKLAEVSFMTRSPASVRCLQSTQGMARCSPV